ncbi:helix-turn-helix domain-containing protein [Streptococcus pneumoniae]
MQLGDIMEKAEAGQYLLLSLLAHKEMSISLKEVGRATNLSRATLLKYRDSLNDLAKERQLEFAICYQEETLWLEMAPDLAWESLVSVLLETSVKYQILCYVFNHEHFSIQSLSQRLMVSEATLNRHLSLLNHLLAEFGISISNGRLKGQEHHIRYFYYELFWRTWPLSQVQKLKQEEHSKHEIIILERLASSSFTEHQKSQLTLWFYISNQREKVNGKEFKALEKLLLPYQDNRFYQRLQLLAPSIFQASDGDADCLFTFLVSMSLLPVSTMEYILGFGGPVMELTTKGIRLLKESDLFGEEVHEQMTYVLSQAFGQVYFYRGVIASSPFDNLGMKDLLRPLMTEKEFSLAEKLVNLVAPNSLALRQKMEGEFLQLICFVADKVSHHVLLGLDMAGNSTQYEVMVTALSHYLGNNRLIYFEPYVENHDYDCVITNSTRTSYRASLVYRIKALVSRKDLQAIASLLRE